MPKTFSLDIILFLLCVVKQTECKQCSDTVTLVNKLITRVMCNIQQVCKIMPNGHLHSFTFHKHTTSFHFSTKTKHVIFFFAVQYASEQKHQNIQQGLPHAAQKNLAAYSVDCCLKQQWVYIHILNTTPQCQ